jgi:polysaccharide pyruvyl transferase WcaK-like protein
MMTDAPAERVARLLEILRPVADELVVAVDSRVEVATLSQLRDLTDRLTRVEYRPPPERMLAWLHRQCRGRWILRIDGDEVPSARLLDELAVATAARDVTHYWLSRRWLHGDDRHWIDAPPWRPDFQPRLVRNDPALLRFPGIMHVEVSEEGPARFLEASLYHSLLLDASEEERAEKAWRYERERPGIRVEGGIAQNAYYLPERFPDLPLADVPADDLTLIEAVRSATPQPAPERPLPIDLVPLAEVDRHWERRPLAGSAYRAQLRPVDPPPRLAAGRTASLTVAVANLGTERWPWQWEAHPMIRLTYRWRDADRRAVGEEGIRTPMPADLHPGTEALVPMAVRAPERPGPHRLAIDLVHELVRWFGCEAVVDIDVAPPNRVALIGSLSPLRRLGPDAIVRAHLMQLADAVPWIEPVLISASPAATERFGCESIEGPGNYLSAGLDQRRRLTGTGLRLERRLARLLADAERVGRGEEPRLVPELGRTFLSGLAPSQLLVVASAGSLTSRSRAELWEQAATALAAAAMGVPVLISGVSVGPFTNRSDRRIAARLFNTAREVVVRDGERSRRALADLGVAPTAIREEPDHAMALRPAPRREAHAALARQGIDGERPFAVANLHQSDWREPALASIAAIVEHLADSGVPTVFMPHCVEGPDDDRRAHALLARLVRPRAEVALLDPLPPDDVLAAIVAGARIAYGTRYHLAVLAAAAGVPALGLLGDTHAQVKLAALRDLAPDGVRAVDVAAGPEAALEAVRELLAGSPAARRPSGHLPAVAWLRAAATTRTEPRRAETQPA